MYLRSFPDNEKSRSLRFLTEEERLCILARVNHDRGDANVEPFNLKKWASSGLDWKVTNRLDALGIALTIRQIWAYATIFGSITTVSYALAYCKYLGYNSRMITPEPCNSSPPDSGLQPWLRYRYIAMPHSPAVRFRRYYGECCASSLVSFINASLRFPQMILTGWWGDRYHTRGPACALNATMALIGLTIVGFHSNAKVRYFGVFFATAGANANIPVAMSYQANNIRGQWKRAFCSATLVGFGALGGIVGSTVFRSEDAPGYVPGISVAMGSQVLILVLVGLLTIDFKRQNEKADRGEKVLEEGDKHFRYTL